MAYTYPLPRARAAHLAHGVRPEALERLGAYRLFKKVSGAGLAESKLGRLGDVGAHKDERRASGHAPRRRGRERTLGDGACLHAPIARVAKRTRECGDGPAHPGGGGGGRSPRRPARRGRVSMRRRSAAARRHRSLSRSIKSMRRRVVQRVARGGATRSPGRSPAGRAARALRRTSQRKRSTPPSPLSRNSSASF